MMRIKRDTLIKSNERKRRLHWFFIREDKISKYIHSNEISCFKVLKHRYSSSKKILTTYVCFHKMTRKYINLWTSCLNPIGIQTMHYRRRERERERFGRYRMHRNTHAYRWSETVALARGGACSSSSSSPPRDVTGWLTSNYAGATEARKWHLAREPGYICSTPPLSSLILSLFLSILYRLACAFSENNLNDKKRALRYFTSNVWFVYSYAERKKKIWKIYINRGYRDYNLHFVKAS